MISNRFNPLGKNLGKTAKAYIQDGLIAMWDGIENVGWGKHDANATTWKDLVGEGVDLELQGGATWTDEGLHFDGTGVAIADNPTHQWSEANTLETAISLVYAARNQAVALIGDSSTSLAVFVMMYGHIINGFNGVTPRRAPNLGGDTLFNPVSITRRRDLSISLNAERVVGDNGDWVTTMNVGRTAIGASTKGRLNALGLVHCVRVYNRALTDDEIAYNYAIDKERFGL